jgi:hypothetical protein
MHWASLETFNIAFGWVRSADEVIALLEDAPRNIDPAGEPESKQSP